MLGVTWPISFDRPAWLWLLMTIPPIVALFWRFMTGIERGRRIAAIVLRCLVILALTLALAGIQYVRTHRNVAVMFVLDRSESVPAELRKSAEDYIRQVARTASRDDRLGVIGFDAQADVALIPSRGGFDVKGFGMVQEPERTDIAAGLRLAMAAFPEGFARRIVLLSDGNQNLGDLTAEIEAARANNIVVDVVPLEYTHSSEILFDRVVVPAQASRDTRAPVRMIVKSRRPTKARLTLYHGDEEVPLDDPIVELSGDMKPDAFTIPVELHSGGIHRFEARISPLNPADDSIPDNNSALGFTFVEDQGKVLILTKPGSTDDKVLYDALLREKIEVDLRGVEAFPLDLLRLQEYSVVILSNVSADTFNEEQHKSLASYVRDFGGGLIMTGGDEGFGAGGWIGKPLEEVSPVTFEVKHKKVMPRGALAIIMHSCEIPRGMEYGIQSAIATVETVSSLDYVGVISYSFRVGGLNWDVPLQLATNKPAIIKKIRDIENGDMPDFEPIMSIVVRDLMALKDVSQRHVIIISDGDPQPPSNATLRKYIDNKITCSTIGIGYGQHVMEGNLISIANATQGRFYPCRNPKQLPQIFVKEAKTVKRPLIDERDFRPRLVGMSQTTLGISPDELPALGGIVLTSPKADAVMPLIRKSTDGDDPLLAHWNYEMGKMAVFTSGWWPKWGTDWAAWEKYGKFWAQLVRWGMRQTGSADFDIATRIDGNVGRVSIEALNKDATYLNGLSFRGKVLTPAMEQRDLRIVQTGPGQYEALFEVSEHGNYLVNMRYTSPDKDSGLVNTGVSVPYSPEFRELGANTALLQQAAERTGGRVLDFSTPTPKLFERPALPSASRQPVWRWVVAWILLPLFLLDVAARRLASALAMSIYVELALLAVGFGAMYAAGARWWGYLGVVIFAELVGWTIRRRSIRPVLEFFVGAVRPQAAEASAQSVSQLKGVREKVRETETRARPTIALDPVTDTKRRFDVGDKAAAEPAPDLTQAVGGADPAQLAAEEKARREKSQQQIGNVGDMAARLRRAKQRAQEEMRDRTEDEKP